MTGVITLDFDPILRLGEPEIRAATVLLALVLLAGLLVAARIGHLTPQPGPYVPAPGLALGDLPFLALGIVPGAVIGGRLDAVLLHLDYYLAQPSAIVDPAQGSLGLALAVPGGVLGGIIIGRLVGAPVDRWMHAAALPMLFVLAGGKLTAVLSAEGQGLPSDLPWATAYSGPGPWQSLAPGVASHPAQVYEAILTTIVLAVLGWLLVSGVFARRDGSALLVAVIGWAAGRALVAFTWRDAEILGPLRTEHLLLAVVIGGCVGGLVRLRIGGRPARFRLRT